MRAAAQPSTPGRFFPALLPGFGCRGNRLDQFSVPRQARLRRGQGRVFMQGQGKRVTDMLDEEGGIPDLQAIVVLKCLALHGKLPVHPDQTAPVLQFDTDPVCQEDQEGDNTGRLGVPDTHARVRTDADGQRKIRVRVKPGSSHVGDADLPDGPSRHGAPAGSYRLFAANREAAGFHAQGHIKNFPDIAVART